MYLHHSNRAPLTPLPLSDFLIFDFNKDNRDLCNVLNVMKCNVKEKFYQIDKNNDKMKKSMKNKIEQ